MTTLTSSKNKRQKLTHLIEKRELGEEVQRKIGFSSNIFMLFGLPTKKLPQGQNQWVKENRKYKMTISQLDSDFDIPYGCYARMNQIFIDTEIKTKKTNVIDLGKSFTEYVKKIGYEKGRANKGLKRQLSNLIRCGISMRSKDDTADMGLQTLIGRRWFLTLDEKSPDQPELFRSRILIDEEYAQYIYKRAVPLDLEVIKFFKRNPLALDFYRFLAYRANGLKKTLTIKDEELFEQLGTDIEAPKITRHRLKSILKQIQAYWQVVAKFEEGRFLLSPSPPAIKPKSLPKAPLQIVHNLDEDK